MLLQGEPGGGRPGPRGPPGLPGPPGPGIPSGPEAGDRQVRPHLHYFCVCFHPTTQPDLLSSVQTFLDIEGSGLVEQEKIKVSSGSQ